MTNSENVLFGAFRNSMRNEDAAFLHLADGTAITYGGMLTRSAQYANALLALGVQPGDRVASQVDKSVDALFLYLGCLRAGAAFLPLNVGYTDKEVAYFVGDAEPHVVVCRPDRVEAVRQIAGDCGIRHVETLQAGGGTLVEKANGASGEVDDVRRGGDDLAGILYTSGTTGRSKGAMVTHDNLLSNALALKEAWRFSEGDVLLHALPIFHTHGLFVATNTILLAGGSMIFMEKFDVDGVISALPRATSMMGVPTFYTRLLASEKFTRELVAHIRVFISGSAPLSATTHREFQERTGHAILERYGMTETNMITSNPYDGARRAGTVGLPLPGVSVRIADPDTGELKAAGEVGVIELKGPNVFKGYWRMPEKTASEFRDDGYFITGDLGLIDDEGYFRIVGREKDLIITGGFNVYPAEVEGAIDEIEGVAECAVIGVPHPDFGEGVTAVVVRSGGDRPCANDLRRALDGELAKFKVPKEYHFLDELPRNKMGKIQKNELRERFAGTFKKG
ncbi:MAG: malonyl-CoA synthase [Alphaproteobacteria bacterium]|nr:malonyl-CoA synthase [Alphaproteobacteria bacterium]